jgi:hypothetical protein
MQPFLAWVLELEACFAERGFWLRSLVRLNAAAPVNCASQRCASQRESPLNRGRLAFEGRLSRCDLAVGSFREVSPSARSARFSALCVSRARGERSSPHSRRPGTAGREGGRWGLGMTARRRCRVARPIGRTTADAADAGAGLFGISMSESKRDDVRRTSPCTNHALAFAQPGTRLPFRGATSRAWLVGCCAVLRVLVAVERCRGRPGRGWGSVGGRGGPLWRLECVVMGL